MKEMISPRRALVYILASLLLVSGPVGSILYYMKYALTQRENDPQFRITAIIRNNFALKTAYLAEWLGLSVDRPVNLYKFDVKEGERKLLETGVIKEVTIKKVKPSYLFIDYKLRTPIALLGDYTHTAIDAEGVLFPFTPFFTKKELPVIYLGNTDAQIALELYAYLKPFRVKQIDVSKAYALSYGQRQIVVILKEQGKTILRLSTHNYPQELANYTVLQGQLKTEGERIIDLRIPHLAFITE